MDTNNSNFKKYYDANSFTINGRLTKEPEVRVSPSGKHYAIITIANNRGDNTNFFTFFAPESNIPFVQSSLHKGCAIDVSGSILPQTETLPDGKKITTYKLLATKFALVATPKNTTGVQNTQTYETPVMPPQPQQNNYQQYSQNTHPQYNNAPQPTPPVQPSQPQPQPQYDGCYLADDDLPF